MAPDNLFSETTSQFEMEIRLGKYGKVIMEHVILGQRYFEIERPDPEGKLLVRAVIYGVESVSFEKGYLLRRLSFQV